MTAMILAIEAQAAVAERRRVLEQMRERALLTTRGSVYAILDELAEADR